MKPRVASHVGPADVVTAGHAALGLLAVVTAPTDLDLAARLVLLAAILDGLDGIVARTYGGSAIGPHIDSLADVASFAVAPAAIVYAAVVADWGLAPLDPTPRYLLVCAVVVGFAVMAILRLALYTAFDTDASYTEGVQTTLAATIIGAAVLAQATEPSLLLAGTVVFTALMVSPIRYPDLLARDALLMGVVHVGAVVAPRALGRALPWALLTLGVAYLLLAPWLYWRGRWRLLEWKGNA
ncbi:MAG: protein sorting system archaetidylserine synthase [Halobacteriales archaeon]